MASNSQPSEQDEALETSTCTLTHAFMTPPSGHVGSFHQGFKMAVRLLRLVPKSLAFRSIYLGLSRASFCSAQDGSLLIEEEKYAWLKDLGLKGDNDGVFNGTWKAGGEVNQNMHMPF